MIRFGLELVGAGTILFAIACGAGRWLERIARDYPRLDGACTHCGGLGCVACDARHL